jgi:hypothetical protein
MPFIKLGEFTEILGTETAESCVSSVSPEVLEQFRKTAASLKRIAPRAEDFLYFSAVMMHAAEASAINEDGSNKLTAKGEPVKVGWDRTGDTWRWVTNDPSIKPYRNSNGDIFPEEELTKAYKKWVHKPLCIDHKSSSVDHVRGFIVDTYYDRNLKRVVALCALDKHNYPDLARKVATGYSNCVSMGTAVGRAICSDCARVARTEADFCDHMRRKSCYGEINVDLNPIELSIVVNGADPQAKIKHIIASARTLNNYIAQKEEEFNKISEQRFSASFNISDPENPNSKTIGLNVSAGNLDSLKEEINKALDQLSVLSSEASALNEENLEKDTNDLASNQSTGTIAMGESEVPTTDLSLAPPTEKLASEDALTELRTELNSMMEAMEAKLSQMKTSLDKLANNSHTQEENMSGSKEINKKGYFQGTEEPTPGQAQYPKDPMNEKLRTDEDRHMVNQDNMGSTEGMHPGDLEAKKMLARAQSEERAMKRNAVVSLAKKALEDKKAYFQNGEGPNNPNTPTPNKPKYPVDKMNVDLRDEDKHMVGQKPFPGVGSVDGMHPSPDSADVSDEKKRKEMLARASLRARFIKASNEDGTQDLSKSAWEVFMGDKLLLTASVDELSGGRSDSLYSEIATKNFGANLIQQVKLYGSDKVRSLIKSAQEVPAAAPAAAPAVEPAPAAEPVVEDKGGEGDPKASAAELAEKVRDLSSDLVEAVRALTGEQAEMGDVGEGMAVAASDSFSTQHLNSLRKEINGALTHAMKEAVAELNNHEEELKMIASLSVGDENEEFFNTIVEDALTEAKTAVADGFKLMTAFVKYARGTKAIVKRAEIEAELEALAEGETMSNPMEGHSDSDLMSLINETNAELDSEMMVDDSDSSDELVALEENASDDNDVQAKPEELKSLEVAPGTKIDVVASFDTKEGRAALRAKLAGETLKVSPMLGEAHPKGGETTELDVKPSGDLAKVEDLEEVHSKMMDVATAPVKVRKEAEAIHTLISEGKLDAADLDALVAEGLDKDAVSYYKKYYAQADGGSEFASELVKEHVKAKLEEELNTYKVKIARAYELAYDMVDRGLVHNDRAAVSAQVDEIMKFNDESFDSLKKVVAKYSPVMRKEAGRMPQVGMFGSSDTSVVHEDDNNLVAQLSAALSKTSKKMF